MAEHEEDRDRRSCSRDDTHPPLAKSTAYREVARNEPNPRERALLRTEGKKEEDRRHRDPDRGLPGVRAQQRLQPGHPEAEREQLRAPDNRGDDFAVHAVNGEERGREQRSHHRHPEVEHQPHHEVSSPAVEQQIDEVVCERLAVTFSREEMVRGRVAVDRGRTVQPGPQPEPRPVIVREVVCRAAQLGDHGVRPTLVHGAGQRVVQREVVAEGRGVGEERQQNEPEDRQPPESLCLRFVHRCRAYPAQRSK